VERVQGQHIKLAKNKNYWQNGRPYLDNVDVMIMADAQAAALQLQAGAIDSISYPALADVARLSKDSNYNTIINAASGNVTFMVLNVANTPLTDKRVRQALNYALDRKRIAEVVQLGLGQPRVLPWATSSTAYDAAKNSMYAFDLDKARALLREANVSSAAFDLVYSSAVTEFDGFTQIFNSDLQKIGLNTSIKKLEAAAWRDALNAANWNGINFGRQQFTHLDPSASYTAVYLLPDGGKTNFKSDRYISMYNAAAAETDKAKAKTQWLALNDFILDEAFALPITSNPTMTVANKKVQGMRYDLHEALVVKDMWLSA
jgi:peptide/nickel transport system substrate-binding protein